MLGANPSVLSCEVGMEPHTVELLAALLFLLIALVGGGFTIKELSMPSVPGWARIVAALLGVFFIAAFFDIRLPVTHTNGESPSPTPTTSSRPRPSSGPLGSQSPAVLNCPAFLRDVPSDRVHVYAMGGSSQEIIASTESQSAPFVVIFTEENVPVGASKWIPSSDLFTLKGLVDSDCSDVMDYLMDNRPNSQVLRDYENMQIHLKRGTFNFSMEHYNGQINVDKFDRAP